MLPLHIDLADREMPVELPLFLVELIKDPSEEASDVTVIGLLLEMEPGDVVHVLAERLGELIAEAFDGCGFLHLPD